jgi:hypothetical protein
MRCLVPSISGRLQSLFCIRFMFCYWFYSRISTVILVVLRMPCVSSSCFCYSSFSSLFFLSVQIFSILLKRLSFNVILLVFLVVTCFFHLLLLFLIYVVCLILFNRLISLASSLLFRMLIVKCSSTLPFHSLIHPHTSCSCPPVVRALIITDLIRMCVFLRLHTL